MGNKTTLGDLFTANNTFNANVTHVYGNSSVNVSINSTAVILSPNTGLSVNGSFGSAGQVLASNGTASYWKTSSGVTFTSSATVPASATIGDMWFDSNNAIMYQYINGGSANTWIEYDHISNTTSYDGGLPNTVYLITILDAGGP